MTLTRSRANTILDLMPAEPLWQRVPLHDDDGRPLGDFMMLIPGLKHFSAHRQQDIITELTRLLSLYQDKIVFVDLNLRFNVLWISYRQQQGLGLELAAAIHTCLPEAKLVAQRHE